MESYSTQSNGNGQATRLDPSAGQDYALGGPYGDPSSLYQQDPVQVLWQRLWLIVLSMVLVTGLAAGFSFSQTPMYQATITVLLEQQRDSSPDSYASDVTNEVGGLQTLATTMTEIIMTQPVAESVAQRLDSPASAAGVQGGLVAEQLGETPLIEVSYTDTSPKRAQTVANTVGEVLSDEFTELSPTTDQGVGARVLNEAELPSAPVSPNPLRNSLLGMVVGLMLGVGLVFLLDYLDNSWKSRDEVEHAVGVPLLGAIPVFRTGKKG